MRSQNQSVLQIEIVEIGQSKCCYFCLVEDIDIIYKMKEAVIRFFFWLFSQILVDILDLRKITSFRCPCFAIMLSELRHIVEF